MRENVFIIFVIAMGVCFVINAYKKWYDSEGEVIDLVKSAGGYTIFIGIVYFIFM